MLQLATAHSLRATLCAGNADEKAPISVWLDGLEARLVQWCRSSPLPPLVFCLWVASAALLGLRFVRAASLYSTRALPYTSPRLLFLFSNLIVAISFFCIFYLSHFVSFHLVLFLTTRIERAFHSFKALDHIP
jgi:hypothetical protein